MGLFVGEGISRLDDDFRDDIDECVRHDSSASTAKVQYKRDDDQDGLTVELGGAASLPCELDDRYVTPT